MEPCIHFARLNGAGQPTGWTARTIAGLDRAAVTIDGGHLALQPIQSTKLSAAARTSLHELRRLARQTVSQWLLA